MADNRIRILASLDDKVSSGLARIRDNFGNLGKQKAYQQFTQGLGLGAGIGAWNLLGSAVGTATDFMFDSIKKASDLNETMSKASVVFGSSADQVDQWGNTTAKSMGLSKQAATEAAATFGNLFNQIGVSKPEVASMSTAFVKLAGDLASFNNIDPTEALEKLRSGLAGEAEPLRMVGVFLSEAKVNAKAAELGFKAVHGQFTEGQKIIARYNVILDETGSAQGDFARTSAGMANQQRILNAELADTEARLGEQMIPVVIDAQRAFIGLFDAVELVNGAGKANSDVTLEQADSALNFTQALGFLLPTMGTLAKAQQDQIKAAEETEKAIENESTGAHDSFVSMNKAGNDAFAALKTGSDDWRTQFEDDSGAIIRSSEKVRRQMSKDAQDIIDSVFGPLETRADAEAAHFQLAADKKILANAKGVKAQHEAKAAIVKDLDDQASALVDLSKTGDLTADDVENFAKDARSAYGSMSAESKAKINGVIDRLRALVKFDGRDVKLGVILKWKSINDTHGPGRGNLEFAEGGRVPGRKGEAQLAVVHGGEFVVSNEMQDQMRLGSSLTMGASAPVGGGLTVNFNSIWPPTRQQAAEIARVVDEAQHGTLRRAAPTGAQGI